MGHETMQEIKEVPQRNSVKFLRYTLATSALTVCFTKSH
jgi:hypothetical protein